LAEEEGGGADGADPDATAFVGDLRGEGGAFVAFGGDEAELDELAGVQVFVELFEELGGEAVFADFDGGFEGLADAAEKGFLRAGEREFIHGRGTKQGGGRVARVAV
jgi:hypothetical protein